MHQQQQLQQQRPDQLCTAANSSSTNSSGGGGSNSSSSSVIRQRLHLPPLPAEAAGLDPDCLSEASVLDKQLEKALLAASSDLYQQMVSAQLLHSKKVSQKYTRACKAVCLHKR
jgi:hypothetical protein